MIQGCRCITRQLSSPLSSNLFGTRLTEQRRNVGSLPTKVRPLTSNGPVSIDGRVLTLDPKKLVALEQEVCDISRKRPTYSVQPYKTDRRRSNARPVRDTVRLDYARDPGADTFFPEKTKGVLYFHHVPHDERASQIRFRLCKDISRFESSRDLYLPNKKPWKRTLERLRKEPKNKPLFSLLAAEFNVDRQTAVYAGYKRPVVSLMPTKFASMEQTILDISKLPKFSASVHTSKVTSSSLPQFRNVFLEFHERATFPQNCKGFFYYEPRPSPGRTCGELRFRLCDDAASFDQGSDLAYDSERHWSLRLKNLDRGPSYEGFRYLILKESQPENNDYLNIPNAPIKLKYPPFLHSLEQPFILDFSHMDHQLHLVTGPTTFETIDLRALLDHKKVLERHTGRALVRLEFSTLPQHTQEGPTLVLRFLELLTPITCSEPSVAGMISPQAGSLYAIKISQADPDPPPIWSCPLEMKRPSRLRRSLTAYIEYLQTRSDSSESEAHPSKPV